MNFQVLKVVLRTTFKARTDFSEKQFTVHMIAYPEELIMPRLDMRDTIYLTLYLTAHNYFSLFHVSILYMYQSHSKMKQYRTVLRTDNLLHTRKA